MDRLPVELVPATDSEQRDQTAFTDFQTPAAQVPGAIPGHAPSSPRQLSDSPDHQIFQDSGKRTREVVEGELTQAYGQSDFIAQTSRSIETTTIDPPQIQHLFTLYVYPFLSLISC